MLGLIEFPADDLGRARRFWEGLFGVKLDDRTVGEGSGAQTHTGKVELGVHSRGSGPGDRLSLPYFTVADLAAALERVVELGGEVIHPGERWAICRDSEGSPFGSRKRRPRKPALAGYTLPRWGVGGEGRSRPSPLLIKRALASAAASRPAASLARSGAE